MKQSDLIKLIQDVFNNELGVSFLKEFRYNLEHQPYTDQPLRTYFINGKLDFIREIEDALEFAPEDLDKLIQSETENLEEENDL